MKKGEVAGKGRGESGENDVTNADASEAIRFATSHKTSAANLVIANHCHFHKYDRKIGYLIR